MHEDDLIEAGGFRFSLRALMVGVALAAFGCLVVSLVLPIFDVPGVFADLPLAEQQVLQSLRDDGVIVDESRSAASCGFNLKCRVMVRRTGDDGRYHATAIQLHGFSDSASELLGKRLRELPELAGIKVLPGWGGDKLLTRLQRELPGRRVEYLRTYGDW
jgi:hypothetical protein